MLIDEKEKLATLFVDNLLRGSISLDPSRYTLKASQGIYDSITTMINLQQQNDLDTK